MSLIAYAGMGDEGDADPACHHGPGGDDAVGLAHGAWFKMGSKKDLIRQRAQSGSLFGEKEIIISKRLDKIFMRDGRVGIFFPVWVADGDCQINFLLPDNLYLIRGEGIGVI